METGGRRSVPPLALISLPTTPMRSRNCWIQSNADLSARQAIPSSQPVHSAASVCGRGRPYLFNLFLTNLVLLLLTL